MKRPEQKLYSQNNLAKKHLAQKLVAASSVNKNDLVIEIGPGKGRLTRELVEKAGSVLAVELDRRLFALLKERMSGVKNLRLVNENFLNYSLPREKYKVFSNIPFSETANIIKKLTSDNNLEEAYLIVQKEAAKKFAGMPYASRNSLMAVLIKPWFEAEVVWEFKRYDFEPMPLVNCVLLKLKRREDPLLPEEKRKDFTRFMTWYFDRNKAARVDIQKLIEIYLES